MALVMASISLAFTTVTINYAFSQTNQGSPDQALSTNQSPNQTSSAAGGAEQTSRVNGSEVFTSNQNATLLNNTGP